MLPSVSFDSVGHARFPRVYSEGGSNRHHIVSDEKVGNLISYTNPHQTGDGVCIEKIPVVKGDKGSENNQELLKTRAELPNAFLGIRKAATLSTTSARSVRKGMPATREGGSALRRFGVAKISVSLLAVIVVCLSTTVVAVVCMIAPFSFAFESIADVVEGSARASFAHCHADVVSLLKTPRQSALTLHKMATAAGLPMAPFLDGWYSNQTWYDTWMGLHLSYAMAHPDLFLQATGFADGQYVGCQSNLDDHDIITCLYTYAGPNAGYRDPSKGAPFLRTNVTRSKGKIVEKLEGFMKYDVRTRQWFLNGMNNRREGARRGEETDAGFGHDAVYFNRGQPMPQNDAVVVTEAAPELATTELATTETATTRPTTTEPATTQLTLLTTTKRPFLGWVPPVFVPPIRGVWADVMFSSIPTVPIISYTIPMRTAAGVLYGVSTFQIALSAIDTAFKRMLKGLHQKAFMLDNKRLLIASSEENKMPFATYSVPLGYTLTPEDVSNNCLRSDENNFQHSLIVCQQSIRQYGYEPLAELAEVWHDLFAQHSVTAATAAVSTTPASNSQPTTTSEKREGTVDLGGDAFFALVSPLEGLGSASEEGMDWRLVVMLRKRDVTGSLMKSRNVAAGVTATVVFVVALLVGVGLRALLIPLAVVAKRMRTSAFLSSDSDEAAAGEVKHAAAAELRIPSYLSEVATIQRSYWAMSDELKLLKAYIPEHLLTEVLSQRRRTPNPERSQTMSPVPQMTTLELEGTVATASSISHPSSVCRGAAKAEASDCELTAMRLKTVAAETPTVAGSGAAKWLAQSPPVLGEEDDGQSLLPDGPHHHVLTHSMDDLTVCIRGGTCQEEELRSVRTLTADLSHRAVSAAGGSDWLPDVRRDPVNDAEPPIFFGDNVLVDRDISIVVVNIVQFHRYVLRHHGTDITRDHAEVVRFVQATARKCGGILETFMGDRFIVSFNATSKCTQHAVAATCFGLEVSSVINKAAVEGLRAKSGGGGKGAASLPRFDAASCGVTVGAATGRAFVGPLGTDTIRRHTIISNAVPEASALERMAIRYPNCSVVIGGDMIPCVEGYCQYLLIDATLLPGSGGKRRRIASVKGGMCAEGCAPSALRGLGDLEAARCRRHSPYASVNASFNAFLEGRVDDCRAALALTNRLIEHRRQGGKVGVSPPNLIVGDSVGGGAHDCWKSGYLPYFTEEQCIDVAMMCEFINSFINSQNPFDGRVYRSSAGDQYMAANERILLDFSESESSLAAQHEAALGGDQQPSLENSHSNSMKGKKNNPSQQVVQKM